MECIVNLTMESQLPQLRRLSILHPTRSAAVTYAMEALPVHHLQVVQVTPVNDMFDWMIQPLNTYAFSKKPILGPTLWRRGMAKSMPISAACID